MTSAAGQDTMTSAMASDRQLCTRATAGAARPSLRRGVALAVPVVLMAALLSWPSCGDAKPAAQQPPARVHPAPGDTLLVVDGVTVTFADVAAQVAFLDKMLPEYDERLKIQNTLTQFTLPLLFARREFAEQRRHQLELARTMRLASGNVEELERNSRDQPVRRGIVTAGEVDLPVAAFLFDATTTGAVSDPIELPQGYVLAGTFDLRVAPQLNRSTCDAMQALFLTHPASQWAAWLGALRDRISTRVTYVHPDYTLAMPPFLKLP